MCHNNIVRTTKEINKMNNLKLIKQYEKTVRYCLKHFHDELHHDYIRQAIKDLREVKNGRTW